jgi:hypothetical protein
MFQRLQSLFNRLAGVAACEADRLAVAHALFASYERRYDGLDTPAYLRRQSKAT